jgi:hypothetical protein
MKETIVELNKKFDDYNKKYNHFDRAMDALATLDDFDGKREMIDKIRTMRNNMLDKRQAVLDAISALQEVCEHRLADGSSAYLPDGNDSHYDYERCSICQHQIKI